MRNAHGGSALAARRLLVVPVLLVGLAACSSDRSGGDDGFGLGSLFGSSSSSQKADPLIPGVEPAKVSTVRAENCPQIEIQAGTGTYRIFEKGLEQQALGLRYQAQVAETARECSLLGAETAMRIGIQGRVLIGPKGGPGKIDVPLRIAVIDDKNQPVYSKAYRIPVEITAGATQVPFTHVEEGVLVPAGPGYYRVLVGFDENAPKTAPARRS